MISIGMMTLHAHIIVSLDSLENFRFVFNTTPSRSTGSVQLSTENRIIFLSCYCLVFSDCFGLFVALMLPALCSITCLHTTLSLIRINVQILYHGRGDRILMRHEQLMHEYVGKNSTTNFLGTNECANV
ncbi:unnamed protein product [Periconia digitata]|uniref:Uncharacterized protein n=1 Tax=Periconia digitata TaxID=1303443 RepID=A0A9W4U9V7_9PLEO|nr:unnamed protein product [Periconia digitata]